MDSYERYRREMEALMRTFGFPGEEYTQHVLPRQTRAKQQLVDETILRECGIEPFVVYSYIEEAEQ